MLKRTRVLEPGGEGGASRDDWLNISLSVALTSDPKPLNKLASLPPRSLKVHSIQILLATAMIIHRLV